MTSEVEKHMGLFSTLRIIHGHFLSEFFEKAFKPLEVKIRENWDLGHAGAEFFETFLHVQDVLFDLIKVGKVFIARPFPQLAVVPVLDDNPFEFRRGPALRSVHSSDGIILLSFWLSAAHSAGILFLFELSYIKSCADERKWSGLKKDETFINF